MDRRPGANESDAGTPTRRHVLAGAGALGLGILIPGSGVFAGDVFAGGGAEMPDAEGFLVVDAKKCMGCGTCMMACSLAHTGESSYSLGRLQVQQDSFGNWPGDLSLSVCRQCADAPCVEACPVGANLPDPQSGNTRIIDPQACVGCGDCIEACPYTPARVQWNPAIGRAQKCDLCRDTPFLGEAGGPGGVQACIQVCPVNAISFVRTMPDQTDPDAYQVNLRGPGWAAAGMSTD